MFATPPTTVPRFAPLLEAELRFDGVDDVVVARLPTPALEQGFTVIFRVDLAELVEEGRNAGVLGIAGAVEQGAWWRVEAAVGQPMQLRVRYNATEVVVPLDGLVPLDGRRARIFVATVYDAAAMALTVTAGGRMSVTVYRNSGADPIQGATAPVTIGHTDAQGDLHFPGSISRVRLFGRALSAAEVAAASAWNGFAASTAEPGLLGDWRMNEGYGPLAFDYAQPADRERHDGDLGGGVPEAAPAWVVARG
ncbi:MAG TPA: LamG-like jellyroll fold domain-containing protein [Longimicrobium sp.]